MSVCDNCSDYLFVYHKDYKKTQRNIKKNVLLWEILIEPCKNTIKNFKRKIIKEDILVDIHRLENFQKIDKKK